MIRGHRNVSNDLRRKRNLSARVNSPCDGLFGFSRTRSKRYYLGQEPTPAIFKESKRTFSQLYLINEVYFENHCTQLIIFIICYILSIDQGLQTTSEHAVISCKVCGKLHSRAS